MARDFYDNFDYIKELFKEAKSAKDMLKLGEQNVYQFIKTCGFAPKKAKAIIETSKILERLRKS